MVAVAMALRFHNVTEAFSGSSVSFMSLRSEGSVLRSYLDKPAKMERGGFSLRVRIVIAGVVERSSSTTNQTLDQLPVDSS